MEFFFFFFQVYAEPVSLIIGSGAIIAVSLFSFFSRCAVYECCSEGWIQLRIADLQNTMQTRLYGQHLAQETVVAAIQSHWNNKNPTKALVMSFHGWTGSGKNYLSSMIADSIFKKGMRSNYVHILISTLHFSNSREIPVYRDKLRQWIHGNVSLCERSLFIFDEVDKMPAKVMDVIKPFVDHYNNVDGVDYRKSIFIFLSNTGGNEVAQKALSYYEQGKIRESITLQEMEEIVISNAYNAEGKFFIHIIHFLIVSFSCGLKMSELISNHLVDHYVPFLPLERRHILLCIRDYLELRGLHPTNNQITAIADSLQYFPKANPIYSSSGCKRIAHKAELFISIEKDKERKSMMEKNSDDDEL
ncbi:unnamed protein product [Dracunculus medinensis]|uniref:Torsin n=1 Tax=Dracunculus medinensis TaxID=318479 RepID=A0A0N4UMN3_DRAME|nr:unnamed protein product [Dracunculus medinensis]